MATFAILAGKSPARCYWERGVSLARSLRILEIGNVAQAKHGFPCGKIIYDQPNTSIAANGRQRHAQS